MPDEFPYDVFLSHSAKDKPVVRDVAERLRKDGLRVWFDEREIRPGDSIPAKIEDGLERSRVMVLCMSANAFGSDWVQLESGTFRFRDPLNKERRFLPLRLDDAPIKGSLAQFLYVNWLPQVREEEYAKLLEACRPLGKPLEAEAKSPDNSAEPKEKLSAVAKGGVVCPNKERSIFWAVEDFPKGSVVSPIAWMGFFVLTNRTSSPLEIDAYELQMQTDDGTWKTLPMFDLRKTTMFNVDGQKEGFSNARLLELKEDLTAKLASGPIPPQSDITGWLLLRDWQPSKGLRLCFRDASAALIHIAIDFRMDAELKNVEGGIKVTQTRKDISGFEKNLTGRRHPPK